MRLIVLPEHEPLTWDESRALASCQLKWRMVKRGDEAKAEARREIRRELWIFWIIALVWVVILGLYWWSR